jgi:hypothetical protein
MGPGPRLQFTPANPVHKLEARSMPPPPLPSNNNSRIAPLQPRGSGPVISSPGSYASASQPFPRLFQRAPAVITGYQEAHSFYNEMREHYARKAYSNSLNVELVVVKARMMTLLPGKKNPTLVWVRRIRL